MKGIIKRRMRYSFTPGKMAKIQNTDEGVKQQELLFTSDGNVKCYSYFGQQFVKWYSYLGQYSGSSSNTET